MKKLIFGTFGVVFGYALLTPASANALSFNVSYTSAVSNDVNFASIQSAVNYVSTEFVNLYSDPVTLNFTVNEGTNGLGSSLFSGNYWRGSYADLSAALIADKKSAADATATAAANLPAADPYGGGATGWYATSAEAKALGLINNNSLFDGTYTFNGTLAYTYDPNNRKVAGQYDFIGVTEHEFSELMGRTSQKATFGYDILDTMRFSSPGTRDAVQDPFVYYSYDNGNTTNAVYNPGSGDRQDFDGTVATDPFNASTGPNQGHTLSNMDTTEMDVIGWDPVGAPEPGTLSLAGIGLGVLVIRRIRARGQAKS